jgi:hypothetical protein
MLKSVLMTLLFLSAISFQARAYDLPGFNCVMVKNKEGVMGATIYRVPGKSPTEYTGRMYWTYSNGESGSEILKIEIKTMNREEFEYETGSQLHSFPLQIPADAGGNVVIRRYAARTSNNLWNKFIGIYSYQTGKLMYKYTYLPGGYQSCRN